MAHWLIKSEPSVYSWDHLVKDKRTSWTGVRNAQAAINLRAMKAGDLCFFYHSNDGKEIVGIAKVAKAAYPDPTDKAGKAVTVDVAPVEPLKQPVTLAAIKADPKFKELGLVRQSRLSVVAGQRRALETDPEDGRHAEVTDNTRGILWMSASVVVFIFNDALIKLAAETAPAVQVIGLRGVFATLWCLLVLLATGGWRRMKTIAHPAVFTRGLLEAVAALTYLVALSHTPFAIATAINLSTPFFLAVLAVVILKEDVRWRRWTAIAVGFVGVLMVIQPQPDDLNAWTWVVVGSSLLGAIRDVLGRYVPSHVPTTVMSFWSAAAVAMLGLGLTLVEGWHPMSTARRACC